MKRFTAIVLALSIAFTVALSGCSGKTGGSDASSSAASESVSPSAPKPVEGPNYIGVRVETEQNGGHIAMDLYMICKDNNITNCGTCEYTPGFNKVDFVGKTYKEGVRNFSGLLKADPNIKIVGLGAMIAGDEDFESYRYDFEEGKNTYCREINVEGIARDTADKFIEMCRISDEKYQGEWKDPGSGGGSGEPQVQHAKTVEDIRKQMDSGIDRVTLGDDITIDVSTDDIFGVAMDCNGFSVTIKGKLDGNAAYKKAGKNVLFELENAAAVNMSELSVSAKSFNKDDFAKTDVMIAVLHDLSSSEVIWPKGVAVRKNTRNMSPIADYLDYNVSGSKMDLTYHGPAYTYADRNKLETAMVKAVLTKGKASGFKDDKGQKLDCQIWTKVTVKVGKSKLPQSEPQEIIIMKGGKLTVKGTIAVTGGRLNFTINGSDCLDIRNLKLTKKHPSPDMVKIRFAKGVKVNMKLLKAKATSGKIKIIKGTDSVDISIW